VPEEIHKQYMTGGKAEKAKLLKMFVEAGFDKDPGFQLGHLSKNLKRIGLINPKMILRKLPLDPS